MDAQKSNLPESEALPEPDVEVFPSEDGQVVVLKKPKRKRDEDPRRMRRSWLIGTIVGVLYGLLARLALGAARSYYPLHQLPIFEDPATMTYGFLAFVPLAIGALSVSVTPRGFRTRYNHTSSLTFRTTLIWLF